MPVIVSFPIKMVIFNAMVSLPEGKYSNNHYKSLHIITINNHQYIILLNHI